MFFTINSIKSLIVNIDGYETQVEIFKECIGFLRSNYKVAFVGSQESLSHVSKLGLKASEVFVPQGSFENALFQNVLLRALKSIGAISCATVYVACNSMYIHHAHELLFGSIILNANNPSPEERFSYFQEFPDFILVNLEGLQQCLDGTRIGYTGEYFAAPASFHILGTTGKKILSPSLVPNFENPDCPISVAGRYFDVTDVRHRIHPFSVRIKYSKHSPTAQSKCLSAVYSLKLERITDLDFITRVPPRPGQEDRLAMLFQPLANSSYANKFHPKILKCIKDYPKLKMLPAKERRDSVRGVFVVDENVDLRNKKIAILEDVTTTGATINETIKVLKEAGAGQIYPIVLGYHPWSAKGLALTERKQVFCNNCSAPLVPRCNSKDGGLFFGCSGWSKDTQHSTMYFTDAVRKLNILESETSYDLLSDDIPF